ncbi:MAG TPA: hypothetical protein VG796_11540 [Verrucomicrobiales bacterium]|jgi:hypothetical protein|nr:hypothetical protein [Verrucomicrobiales bacterium]
MKKFTLPAVAGVVAAAVVVLVISYNRSPESGDLPSTPGGLEAAIEQSLQKANPTKAELEREIALLEKSAQLANELTSAADPTKTGRVNPAAKTGPVVDRGYDLAALEARFTETLQNSDNHARRRSLEEIAGFLAGKDAETAKRFLQAILSTRDELTSSDARNFTAYFIDALSKHDAPAAARWTESLSERLKFPAHQLLARNWVQKDPVSLEAWSRAIENDGLRANVIQAMGHMLTHSDPNGFAAEWAKRVAESPRDGSRMSEIVSTLWGKADFNAAAEWVSGLTNPDDRQRGIIALVRTRAEADAKAAATWAVEKLEAETRGLAIQEAMRSWAKKDPAAAAEWVSANGDKQVTDNAFDAIALAWLRKDEKAAQGWIEKASVSEERKNYIYAMTRS